VTRTLGAGIAADAAAATGERCQFIKLEFADSDNVPTSVYLTTAAQDITWDGKPWEAVGGTLEIDAMGESSDGAANGLRIKLSGVDQSVLALILGSRWRGRNATIYHVALDQATGTVKADPVIMYTGPMNGGFQIGESRGDFGGGTVDISARLSSRLDDLVKVRGVRCNEASHNATIPTGLSVLTMTDATPVSVTTAAPHGLGTGARINLSLAGGLGSQGFSSPVLGDFTITVTGASTFTLDGTSAPGGTYTANSTTCSWQDTFFQNVPSLMNRKLWWGVKSPITGTPHGPPILPQGGGTNSNPWNLPGGPQGTPPPLSPWPNVNPPPPPPTPNMDPGRT
jgi:hypothetical protein